MILDDGGDATMLVHHGPAPPRTADVALSSRQAGFERRGSFLSR